MQLTDVNVLIAIISGLIGIYAGYKRALSEASKIGENNAQITTMLKYHSELLDKIDNKLETSIEDRRELHAKVSAHEEQLKSLLEDVKDIKDNCRECRKKC